MGIMDNEGHDPMGFGNVRPAQSADRAEIKRLQAGWDQAFRIGVAAQEDNARLRAALKPFALVGLDVKKEHPGWANNVFSGQWCGYGLTYLQFARAAELFDDEQAAPQSEPYPDEPSEVTIRRERSEWDKGRQ